MTRKTLAIIGILAMLLISTFGTVAAQDTPPVNPVTEGEGDGDGTVTVAHPMVTLLINYYGRVIYDEKGDEIPDVSLDPEALTTEINQLRDEEGIGFGVLVKLYAMAEANRLACAEQAAAESVAAQETGTEPELTCPALTGKELADKFLAGEGVGKLFKEFGKPALLGVGHVKKADKEYRSQQEEEGTTITTEKGNKGNKPPKKDKKNDR